MKYAKELSNLVRTLPAILQDDSLDYKQWKKRCKYMPINQALALLLEQCRQVETTFSFGYEKWAHPPRFTCFKGIQHNIPPNTLLQFAQINSKTVYKICKRLYKLHKDPLPMTWLTSLRASHQFGFLGGHHTSHLSLSQSGSSLECPICTEQVDKKTMLVYSCGHNACISCTLQYAKITEHGLWYNILSSARRRDCPYCHFNQALTNITTV